MLITEHQRGKQNSVHVRGSRGFCSLQAVGFSVVAFIFSCCESKTVNRTGTKAEMETEEALHPYSRPPKPASIRLTSPPSTIWSFAVGISKVKWLLCYCYEESPHPVGAATRVKSPPGLLLYTLLLEPSQLDFSAYGCDEQNCKCGK